AYSMGYGFWQALRDPAQRLQISCCENALINEHLTGWRRLASKIVVVIVNDRAEPSDPEIALERANIRTRNDIAGRAIAGQIRNENLPCAGNLRQRQCLRQWTEKVADKTQLKRFGQVKHPTKGNLVGAVQRVRPGEMKRVSSVECSCWQYLRLAWADKARERI